MFIAKRTERDGILIAYEGECMSEQEAVRRGLLTEQPAKAEKAPARKAPAKKAATRKAPAKKAPAKKKED